ncbi:MAG: sporulation initiation factor Spo0A C-terminal domain-containing protein [Lachnospiraceae bacterium]|jgi:two-component system response regulator (stage 0 sporulation protein A)|nr:sporulation initiation factor Spo0A C-terminal domain-containing protein [Lachnospiraceae bacterium]
MENQAEKSLEELLFDMMVNMGVPAHLKGYHYLKAAVMLVSEDMRAVGSVTKLLYPEIAKRYNTTDGKVERAIRNAIEVSWERGNPKAFEELFGYSKENGYTRPTNSEYIAAIADALILKGMAS